MLRLPAFTLRQWPRFLLLWVFTPLVALMSWRFLIGGVEVTMPHMTHHALDRQIAFYLHVGLGPVALMLVPFQFWSGLRRRRPGLHRWSGRLYGLAILLAGYGGTKMALGTLAGPVAAWGFGMLSVLWVSVTAAAVWFALQRRFVLHRDWMIRSAALTLAGTTLRLELPLLLALGVSFETAYVTVAWLCWVPNVLIAEWIIQNRSLRASGPRLA